MAGGPSGMEKRLAPLRGRLALSRAMEDLQRGLPIGAALALLLGLLRWLDLVPLGAGAAAAAGLVLALLFPAAGVLLRRTSARLVADIADERLGLAERVGTALALEAGEAPPTPLGPLVAEDARRALDHAAPASLRRAFRPRFLPRPAGAAAAASLLALVLLRAEPLESPAEPRDPAAAYRERKEKEEAARSARRVREAAAGVEDLADPKHAALRAVAAELRRQSDALLRQAPPKAEAMAAFQKMGELVRERQEMLAGVGAGKLAAMKADGSLSKADADLQKLLSTLAGADLGGLNEQMAGLDRALRGAADPGDWTPERLAALQRDLENLASALEKGGASLEEREALRKALKILGNPDLLRELAGRLAKLRETLEKQGWQACRDPGGLNAGGLGGTDPGEPLSLTDEELLAMIERLKELQELADLGRLAFCQNCGLSGGT